MINPRGCWEHRAGKKQEEEPWGADWEQSGPLDHSAPEEYTHTHTHSCRGWNPGQMSPREHMPSGQALSPGRAGLCSQAGCFVPLCWAAKGQTGWLAAALETSPRSPPSSFRGCGPVTQQT